MCSVDAPRIIRIKPFVSQHKQRRFNSPIPPSWKTLCIQQKMHHNASNEGEMVKQSQGCLVSTERKPLGLGIQTPFISSNEISRCSRKISRLRTAKFSKNLHYSKPSSWLRKAHFLSRRAFHTLIAQRKERGGIHELERLQKRGEGRNQDTRGACGYTYPWKKHDNE